MTVAVAAAAEAGAVGAVPRDYNFAADVLQKNLDAGRAGKPAYIDARGTHTYGMTLCDARHLRAGDPSSGAITGPRGEAPNAEVAVGVNADRFWEMFLDVLATYP